MQRPERLRDEFLARDGVGPGVSRRIDPDDEMWKTIVRHARRPEHHLVDYFRTGAESFGWLDHVQRAIGRPLRELDAVLDFAAGWGRTTRHLVDALGADRVFVSDIAAASMDFCRQEFGVAAFASDLDPSRVVAPRRFDLVFVGSLFTHLPRPRFEAWMARLLDMLAPGGSLVFTTHGSGRIDADLRDPSGFTYREHSPIDYLPVSEYASTYVDVPVVHDIVRAAGAAQVTTAERGLWYHHDVHVARHDAAPGLDPLGLPGVVHGRLERIEEIRPGHGWVGGYLVVAADHGPIDAVELWIDGSRVGEFSNVAPAEPRSVFGEPDPRWLSTSFFEEGDIRALGAGEHPVAAVVVTGTGLRRCADVGVLVTRG